MLYNTSPHELFEESILPA